MFGRLCVRSGRQECTSRAAAGSTEEAISSGECAAGKGEVTRWIPNPGICTNPTDGDHALWHARACEEMAWILLRKDLPVLRPVLAVIGAPLTSAEKATRVVAGEVPRGSPLFTVLWEALADTLGTAAAATLMRRAAQRAAPRWPELAALSITRESLDYCYRVPSAWDDPAPDPPPALCDLARELWVLLVDLTGSVVVNRLAQVPELRALGLVPPREEQP
jgi:hypothetical protein